MGDNLVPNGLFEGLPAFLLQVEVSEIIDLRLFSKGQIISPGKYLPVVLRCYVAMAIEKMARSLNDTSAARARFFEDAVFKNS